MQPKVHPWIYCASVQGISKLIFTRLIYIFNGLFLEMGHRNSIRPATRLFVVLSYEIVKQFFYNTSRGHQNTRY